MVKFIGYFCILLALSFYEAETENVITSGEETWEWKSDSTQPIGKGETEKTLTDAQKTEEIKPRFVSKMKKSICKGLGMGDKCAKATTKKENIRNRRNTKLQRVSQKSLSDPGEETSSRLIGSGFDGLFGSSIVPSVGVHLGSLLNNAGGNHLHGSPYTGEHKNPLQFDLGPISVNPFAGVKLAFFNGRPILSPSIDFLISHKKHNNHNIGPYTESIPSYSYDSQPAGNHPFGNQYMDNPGIGGLPLGSYHPSSALGYNQALFPGHHNPPHPSLNRPHFPSPGYYNSHNPILAHPSVPQFGSDFTPHQVYPPIDHVRRPHRHTLPTNKDQFNKYDYSQGVHPPVKDNRNPPTSHLPASESQDVHTFIHKNQHGPIGYKRNAESVKKDLFIKEKRTPVRDESPQFSHFGRISSKRVNPLRGRENVFALG